MLRSYIQLSPMLRDSMLATGKRIVRRLADIRRRYGILAVIQLLADRLVNRLVHVDIMDILGLDAEHLRLLPHRYSEFTFRFLTADEVRAFAADPSNELGVGMAERINAGHNLCFAALAGGRLAAYGWYALESIEAEHAEGVAMSYPRHVAYAYKAFTHPDFRGKGLIAAISELGIQSMAEQGIRRVIGLVRWTNWPMLRNCYSIGHVLLGRMVLIRLRDCQVLMITRGAKHFGIQFGKKAVARQPKPAASSPRA